MSEILLGQSYYLRFDAKLWTAMQPYPPLGTLYAASVLRASGYEVALFDAMLAESEEAWAEALDHERPRLAILYEDNFNYLSKMCLLRMRQAAFKMIEMAHVRSCTVIVCGADASDHAEKYLAAGADFIVIGEGEQTLLELVDNLMGRTRPEAPAGFPRPLASIDGLAFASNKAHPEDFRGTEAPRPDSGAQWAPSGRPPLSALAHTPRRQDIKHLDVLPFPAWDLVDIPRYQAIWRQHHGYYSMNMVTTRGCPYHCNWCAKPIWGQRYNVRSPESVVAEMKWLQQIFHPDHIWFVDDILGLKPGWLTRFAAQVDKENVRIPFKCLNRADLLLRDGAVDDLRRAGCCTVWIGAESGSQKVLDAMEKGIRVEQIVEATGRLHAANIQVGFFLQFGYPVEEREDIERTLQMVRDCQPDDIGISVSYPLPGTKFYERVKSQLGEKQNWLDSNDLAMLYKGPYTTEFYRQLHIVVHKEFRARRTWRELVSLVKQPVNVERVQRRPGAGALRAPTLRQVAAMVYNVATLPLARRRLDQLAMLPHTGTVATPAELDRNAAATPSPQVERL
jgi:radical SAM superfamily enzyme YgiQ (UPF0313 family)